MLRHVLIGPHGRHEIATEDLASQEEKECAALLVVEKLVEFNLQGFNENLVPPLYTSGLGYRAEAHFDGYADAMTCARRGYADAAEIVAWRCAELRQSGEDVGAKPMICREQRGDGPGYSYYTAKVLRSDGTIENPVETIRNQLGG